MLTHPKCFGRRASRGDEQTGAAQWCIVNQLAHQVASDMSVQDGGLGGRWQELPTSGLAECQKGQPIGVWTE